MEVPDFSQCVDKSRVHVETQNAVHTNAKDPNPPTFPKLLTENVFDPTAPPEPTTTLSKSNNTTDFIIGDIFSVKNPRDAGAGLSSGIKSLGKGFGLGAVSLVLCPIVGATRDGLGGFFKGIGAGILSAITLPVTSIGVAGYQITRGVINTPTAIYEWSNGKKWNKKTRKWGEDWYSLVEEANQVLKDCPELDYKKCETIETSSGAATERDVVDDEFYRILEVSTSATQEEIRRQYYKIAKKCHPDKNVSDPNAADNFQKLGQAYQVLGDEKRRAKYDKFGKAALDSMPIIDSSLFFMMLFGSEILEPYIGKLRMAMFVEIELEQSVNPSSELFQKQQTKREVLLAIQLRDRIRPYCYGDVISWRIAILQEARRLCETSFGDSIVNAIGWTYKNYGKQFLGKKDTFLGVKGRYAKFQEYKRTLANNLKAMASMVKAAIISKRVSFSEDQDEAGNEQERAISSNLPMILETMLQVCLMDVENTIRNVSKKLLKDMMVDLAMRKKRAQALIELGNIFQQAAMEHMSKNDKDARQRMEEALIKAIEKTNKGKDGDMYYYNNVYFNNEDEIVPTDGFY